MKHKQFYSCTNLFYENSSFIICKTAEVSTSMVSIFIIIMKKGNMTVKYGYAIRNMIMKYYCEIWLWNMNVKYDCEIWLRTYNTPTYQNYLCFKRPLLYTLLNILLRDLLLQNHSKQSQDSNFGLPRGRRKYRMGNG